MLSPNRTASPIDGTCAAAIRWVLVGAGVRDGFLCRVVLRSGWLGEDLVVELGGKRVLVPLRGARLEADGLRLEPTRVSGETHPLFHTIIRHVDQAAAPLEYAEAGLAQGDEIELHARLEPTTREGGFREPARALEIDARAQGPIRIVSRRTAV